MKKKILILALALGLSMGAVSCGKEEADTTATQPVAASTEKKMTLQDEILIFVGDSLPSISGDRDRAVLLYNDYFTAAGNEKDSEKWMTTLSEEALPKYDTYLSNLKALKTTFPEVTQLKELYLASAQLQRDAIQLVVDAIKNADSSILDSAQQKVEQSRDKLREYNDSLKKLCEENNITLEGLGGTEDTESTGDTENQTSEGTESSEGE